MLAWRLGLLPGRFSSFCGRRYARRFPGSGTHPGGSRGSDLVRIIGSQQTIFG